MLFLPVLVELVQLGEGREVGHSVEEQFSVQMVQFMLDTDRKEIRGFKVQGRSVPVESLNANHRRTHDLAPQPIYAEAPLPVLDLMGSVIHDSRIHQDRLGKSSNRVLWTPSGRELGGVPQRGWGP